MYGLNAMLLHTRTILRRRRRIHVIKMLFKADASDDIDASETAKRN